MNDSTPTEGSLSPAELDQVIAICGRFEAAWKAGSPLRLEDLPADAPESLRSELFRRLLALEVELRRKRGDRPDPAEYRGRFPDRLADVAAAFGAAGPEPGPMPHRPRSGGDLHSDAAHNLLFGLLAFQNGFIDRGALLGAFGAWVADRSRTIGQLLLDLGALDPARHGLLEALVSEHLKLHGGDAERSLADLSSLDGMAADLRRLPGEDVQASVAAVGRDRPGAEVTTPWPEGGGPKSGGRFRILRLHAEGGLGRVYEAHDAEFGRTVALKEIRPDRADDGAYPRAVRAGGGDQRRIAAPGHRPGLQPGPLRRRQAVLRHAVRRRVEPQAEDPRPPPGAPPTRRRASSGRCSIGSWTSATRSPSRTAGACCTATSSRTTSCWGTMARP